MFGSFKNPAQINNYLIQYIEIAGILLITILKICLCRNTFDRKRIYANPSSYYPNPNPNTNPNPKARSTLGVHSPA